MSDAASSPGEDALRASAMFATLVSQNTTMAMIFLGHAPNPQTGKAEQDLDHARFFIDQLEMLAVKTKGNLDKQESAVLQNSLTHLRLAYVDAVSHPMTDADASSPPTDEQERPTAEPAPEGETAGNTAIIHNTGEIKKTDIEESKKRFSKKY